MIIRKFKDPKTASKAMAEELKAIAVKAVAENNRFTIALTGGSSPIMLHEILSSDGYRSSVPWEQFFVFWGDERAVPFDDDQNNAKMGYETLLDNVPVPTGQIFRMNSEIVPEKAAEEYEAILRDHFKQDRPSFDLILLGMGNDGHTASLFPGTEVVHEQHKWVSKGYNKEQDSPRITLTAPLLNKAKNVFFAVFGESKAETLKQVLQGDYNPKKLPAQLIRPESGKVVWYIDEKAGELLAS